MARRAIATSIERISAHGGAKTYTAVWPFKFGRQRRAKEDGNKGEGKNHRRPTQPVGYPSGKCMGAGKEALCRCGKHNRSAHARR